MIEVNSLGAEIYWDGVFIGFIGEPIGDLVKRVQEKGLDTPEKHKIVVKKQGYEDLEIEVWGEPGVLLPKFFADPKLYPKPKLTIFDFIIPTSSFLFGYYMGRRR